jgi:CHRD domain
LSHFDIRGSSAKTKSFVTQCFDYSKLGTEGLLATLQVEKYGGRMKHSRRLIGVTCCALGIGTTFLPMRAEAAPISFGAVVLAAEETTAPAAVDAAAAGTVDLTVDAATGDVCVQSSLSGLSGAITMAHIHTGAAGVAGPVFITLPTTATTVAGCASATPAQAQAILNSPNGFYFNVHTAASPGGAMRGQLSSSVFNATLTGAAEVPVAGDPDGTGQAVVAVDVAGGRTCVYTSVAAIDLPAISAHIHSGVAGVAGAVVVPLTAPKLAISASCAQPAAGVIASLLASPAGHYVNVHTTPFPGGALRGQLVVRAAIGVPVALVFPTIPQAVSSTVAPSTVAPTTVATTIASSTTTSVAPTVAPTTVPAATTPPTTADTSTPAVPAQPIDEAPDYAG